MAGLLIGLTGFVLIPILTPEAPVEARWGILLWYPTMGAVIAMLEMLGSAGMLPWRVRWWLCGGIVGGWFNLLAVLIGDPFMGDFITAAFGADSPLGTPYLFVPEGALAGMLIAYLVMRFGGEGRAIEDD
ncbi:MAG: hypothetical protein AAFV49_05385 [Pseudomonadota bacterium]